MKRKAAGVALVCAEHVLLVKRAAWLSNEPETWCIPGGSIELGEPALLGALRELWEEAGVWLSGMEVLRSVEIGIFSTFLAVVRERPQVVLNEEATEYEWVPLARLTHMQENRELHSGVFPAMRSLFPKEL